MGFSASDEARLVGDAYEKFPLCIAVSTADLEASYFIESRS